MHHQQQNRHDKNKQPRQVSTKEDHHERSRQYLRSGERQQEVVSLVVTTKQHQDHHSSSSRRKKKNLLVMKNDRSTTSSAASPSSSKNGTVLVNGQSLPLLRRIYQQKEKSTPSSSSKQVYDDALQEVEKSNRRRRAGQITTKKVYVCDVCKRAYFNTYKEAEDHEKQCRGVPPCRPASSTHVVDADTSIIKKDAAGENCTIIEKNAIVLSPASSPIRSKKETSLLPLPIDNSKKNPGDVETALEGRRVIINEKRSATTDENEIGEFIVIENKSDETRGKIQQNNEIMIPTSSMTQASNADGSNNVAVAVGMQSKY